MWSPRDRTPLYHDKGWLCLGANNPWGLQHNLKTGFVVSICTPGEFWYSPEPVIMVQGLQPQFLFPSLSVLVYLGTSVPLPGNQHTQGKSVLPANVAVALTALFCSSLSSQSTYLHGPHGGPPQWLAQDPELFPAFQGNLSLRLIRFFFPKKTPRLLTWELKTVLM